MRAAAHQDRVLSRMWRSMPEISVYSTSPFSLSHICDPDPWSDRAFLWCVIGSSYHATSVNEEGFETPHQCNFDARTPSPHHLCGVSATAEKLPDAVTFQGVSTRELPSLPASPIPLHLVLYVLPCIQSLQLFKDAITKRVEATETGNKSKGRVGGLREVFTQIQSLIPASASYMGPISTAATLIRGEWVDKPSSQRVLAIRGEIKVDAYIFRVRMS